MEKYIGDLTPACTVCVKDKKLLFIEPEVVEVFTSKLFDHAGRQECWIPLYCFMPDHLHFLVKGINDHSKPKEAVDRFKISTAIWLGTYRPGFKMQHSFHDHVVRVHQDWQRQAFYIFNNPVRAGLVRNPYEYPFSGCQPFEGHNLEEMFYDLTA